MAIYSGDRRTALCNARVQDRHRVWNVARMAEFVPSGGGETLRSGRETTHQT